MDTALKLHAVNGSAIPLVDAASIAVKIGDGGAVANVFVPDALD